MVALHPIPSYLHSKKFTEEVGGKLYFRWQEPCLVAVAIKSGPPGPRRLTGGAAGDCVGYRQLGAFQFPAQDVRTAVEIAEGARTKQQFGGLEDR